MKRLILFIAAMLLVTPAAIAHNHPNKLMSSQLVDVVSDHDRARDGTKGLAAEVTDKLQAILDEGDNPLALAYLGSAYTLRGRDAKSPLNAMRYTNRGIRIMDEAVDIAPDNFTIRLIRALNNFRLPEMFGRGAKSLEDMSVAVDLYDKAPHPARAAALRPALNALIKSAENKGDAAAAAKWRRKREDIGL